MTIEESLDESEPQSQTPYVVVYEGMEIRCLTAMDAIMLIDKLTGERFAKLSYEQFELLVRNQKSESKR